MSTSRVVNGTRRRAIYRSHGSGNTTTPGSEKHKITDMKRSPNIKSHIDYASTLWDECSENLFKKLCSLYRRSAKLINPDPTLTTEEKLCSLDMLPLKQHLQLNKSIFMYKYFSGFLPEYLNDLLPKIKDTKYASSRCTISMPGPTPRIDLVQTSLCFSGGILWEKLPSELRNASSLLTFKNLAYRFFCENV